MRKLTVLCLLAVSLMATAQTHVLEVNTKKLGAPIQPTMYGIFFEDINYAADGGLYAEMVKNLPLTMNLKPVAGQAGQDGLFASSVFDKTTGEVIVKVVNTSKQPQNITLNLLGLQGTPSATTITLCHDGMDDENCLDNPEKITPKTGYIQCEANKKSTILNDEISPMSFRIYKMKHQGK